MNGLRMYDHLPPDQAVLKAWTEPGPVPSHHALMQQQVREAMPLLARALDRQAATRRLRTPPRPPRTFTDPITDRAAQVHAAVKRHVDERIRAALAEQGVDPAIVEDIARRAQAGEFDPPPPTIRITNPKEDT